MTHMFLSKRIANVFDIWVCVDYLVVPKVSFSYVIRRRNTLWLWLQLWYEHVMYYQDCKTVLKMIIFAYTVFDR